jgi:hypothetical protein
VFPVRYELNSYILFRINCIFKGLIKSNTTKTITKRKLLFYHFSSDELFHIQCNKLLTLIC